MAGVVQTKVIAMTIAGLGDPTLELPLRINPTISTTVGSTGEYVRLMVPRSLSSVSAEVDPLEGTTTQGTISCRITGLTDTGQLGHRVRQFLMSSRPDPVAKLNADISSSATTVDVNPIPGRPAFSVGATLYLEREAMHIQTYSAGTGTGGSDRLTVVRGAFGTTAAAHTANDTDDVLCYSDDYDNGSGNPIVEGREVTLWLYDHAADTESQIWAGYLESPSEEQGTISISARDLWSYAWGKKLGAGAFSGYGVIFRHTGVPGVRALSDQPVLVDYPMLLIGGTSTTVSNEEVVALVDIEATGDSSDEEYRIAETPRTSGGAVPSYPTVFGARPEQTTAEPPVLADEPLRQCITGAPDARYFRDSSNALSSHPFDVIVSILKSTGSATWTSGGGFTQGGNGAQDCLPEPFGLGVPGALINTTAIDALKADPPYAGLSMEALCIGAEGPEDASEVLQRIFKATFTFPAIDSTGKLTIRDLRDPGSGNADFTLGEYEIRAFRKVPTRHTRSTWPLIDQMFVKIAQQGLKGKPAIIYNALDFRGATRKRYPSLATDVEIDAGAFGQVSGQGVSEPLNRDRLKALYAWRYQLQTEPLPVYEFGITGAQGFVTAGSTVEITHPGLLDRDASRGITSHRCVVLRAETDYWDFSQRLTVIDLFPITRTSYNTAPAWRISAVTSSSEFTIDSTHFTGGVGGATDYDSWIDDANVLLFDQYGALRSTDGVEVGTHVGGGAIEMSNNWTASTVTVTPNVGDIVRIADYDNRSTDWSDRAYMADSSGKLGAANDDAHRWGF